MIPFKDLKAGYTLYILDKQNIGITQAKVTNVSLPHVDAKIGGVTNLVVDVTVDGGKIYVMVADNDCAYPDGMFITTDMQPLLREVTAMKSNSEQVIAQMDRHKTIVAKCNELLAELDPVQKEKQQNEARFNKIEDNLTQLMEMLKKIAE